MSINAMNVQVKTDNPRVTVIVTTYNRPVYLKQTLQCILSQTFTDFELLVISDGYSTDDEALVRQLSDARLRYLYCDHHGYPAPARNLGLNQARGEYVAFCDDDDLWEPEKLTLQVRCLAKRPDAVLVYTGAVRIDEHSQIMGICKTPPDRYDADPLRGFLSIPFYWIFWSSVMIRREIIGQVGAFNEHPQLKGREDAEFLIRIAARTRGKFAKIAKPLLRYRHVSNSISHQPEFSTPERYAFFYETLKRDGTLAGDAHLTFVSNQFSRLAFNSVRYEWNFRQCNKYAREAYAHKKAVISLLLIAMSLPVALLQGILEKYSAGSGSS